jgi:zinc transport system substrate-binding protein
MLCAETLLARSSAAPVVVVTTSMLESAVRAIEPSKDKIAVERIISPGSCPGHFDLSPRIVPTLKNASLVIRHDYQGVLESKIAGLGVRNVPSIAIETPGSLLIPSHYAALIERIASALPEILPGECGSVQKAVEQARNRSSALESSMRERIAPWRGRPVVASINQKELCEWLGFRVVGILERPEDVSPQDMENLASCGAELVIGNLQEGTEAVLSLGRRMKVPVAVLSNFPGAPGYGSGYDQLIDENMKRIVDAWR